MWNTAPEWAIAIVVVAAVGTAVFKILKWLYEFSGRIHDVTEAWPVLKDISDEMKPNGGTTFRDAVDRIEVEVKASEEKWARQTEVNDELIVGQALIRQAMAEIRQAMRDLVDEKDDV